METLKERDNYLISIVVPTYQRPALLAKCIDALRLQDFPHARYEIIVVSDGFDAETGSFIKEDMHNFPQVKFLSLPAKAGPAAARNLGWQNARSELIVFTDDDCIPDSGWLTSFYKAYVATGKKEIAFAGNTIVPVNPVPTDYEKNVAQLAQAEFITANCSCTKNALMKVGGLDERFTMAWREDSDLQFKLMGHGIPILKVADAIVTHPVRKAPWGISIKEERKGIFNALLFKKYPRLYKEKIQPTPPWNYYFIALFLLGTIGALILGIPWLAKLGFAGWLVMTTVFIIKRLSSTSRSWDHILEMIFTSAVIPVISLYWRFYGSLKFKVLLIP